VNQAQVPVPFLQDEHQDPHRSDWLDTCLFHFEDVDKLIPSTDGPCLNSKLNCEIRFSRKIPVLTVPPFFIVWPVLVVFFLLLYPLQLVHPRICGAADRSWPSGAYLDADCIHVLPSPFLRRVRDQVSSPRIEDRISVELLRHSCMNAIHLAMRPLHTGST
jgi:hypothetical protein